MAKKPEKKIFTNLEEYRAYFRALPESSKPKGSKYYRLGRDIAKMACEKSAGHTQADQPSVASTLLSKSRI